MDIAVMHFDRLSVGLPGVQYETQWHSGACTELSANEHFHQKWIQFYVF